MSESGFNGRKRESEPYEIGHTVAPLWGIVNMQMYVDGAFDCFVKEVPVNDDDSGYMTYECGYDVTKASLYRSEEQARELIRVYHMPDRVYIPIEVQKGIEYRVDPKNIFTKEH